MKFQAIWLGIAFFVLAPAMGVGADVMNSVDKDRKDVVEALASIRQASVQLTADKKDASEIKTRLSGSGAIGMTPQERQNLRLRASNDQDDIQTQTEVIVGDMNLLKYKWDALTPDEQKFVEEVDRDLKTE